MVVKTAKQAALTGVAKENPVIGAVAQQANEKHEQKKAAKSQKAQAAKTEGNASSPSRKKGLGLTVGSKLGNKNLLLGEMIVCLVILGLGTIVSPQGSDDGVHRMMIKGSALMGVFFILAIVSTGGKGAQKTASALGALVALSYILTSSDVKNIANWSKNFFNSANTAKTKAKVPETAPTPGPSSSANPPPSVQYV